MGFTVAFNLRDLSNRLPQHAGTGIVGCNSLTLNRRLGKHIAFGDIRVMGDGDKAAIGTLRRLV